MIRNGKYPKISITIFTSWEMNNRVNFQESFHSRIYMIHYGKYQSVYSVLGYVNGKYQSHSHDNGLNFQEIFHPDMHDTLMGYINQYIHID